jgi:hypothetical protein
MSEEALNDAVQAYARAFKEAPPMIFAVAPERYGRLMRAMARAVQRGRPLSRADVYRAAGIAGDPPQNEGEAIPMPMCATPEDPLAGAMAPQPAPEDAPASCPPPPHTPEVERAVKAYCRKFGRFKTPYLSGRYPETEARLLRRAVKRKRPLKFWVIERVTGGWRRDPGPDVQL